MYLQNTTLIGARITEYRGLHPLPLDTFWSLAVEEQFYLVWPLVVFLVKSRKGLMWFCAASLVLCPAFRIFLWSHGSTYFGVHNNTLCRADALLAGGLLALLLRGRYRDAVLRCAPWVGLPCLIAAYVPLHGMVLDGGQPWFRYVAISLRYSAMVMASFGLLSFAIGSVAGRVVFSWPPLRWLGKYSYGGYVLHLVLFNALREPLREGLRAAGVHNAAVAGVLVGVLSFLLTMGAAYASYQLFERHFLKLKRYFDYRPHPNTAS